MLQECDFRISLASLFYVKCKAWLQTFSSNDLACHGISFQTTRWRTLGLKLIVQTLSPREDEDGVLDKGMVCLSLQPNKNHRV